MHVPEEELQVAQAVSVRDEDGDAVAREAAVRPPPAAGP